eukprot:GEMP01016739.1.p2 GENE.GEMP01016739.1~~GEMP01016739.1.p2  ORF type:complete len:331 (+),score=66.86 GEMP01016739.1:213-1205(+)
MRTAVFVLFIVRNSQAQQEQSSLANAGNAQVECRIPETLGMAACVLTLAAPFNTQLPLDMHSCTADTPDAQALCAEVNFPSHGPRRGIVGDGRLLLVVHPSASTFRVHVRDPSSNDYTAGGALREWHKWRAPSRVPVVQIAVHGRRLGGPESLFSSGNNFGVRYDCRTEECPSRWKDCWQAKNEYVNMLQVMIAVVLEQTFCDAFSSTEFSVCVNYVEGVFRDANLIYERQMGMHLTMAYVFTPDVVAREFPRLAKPTSEDGEIYLHSFDDYFARSTPTVNKTEQCATAPKFREVTGYEYDQFGLIHVFTNLPLKDTQMTAVDLRTRNWP